MSETNKNEKRSILIRKIKSIKYIKYTKEENKERFLYFFAKVLKEYYENGKIDHVSSEYKTLFNIRKKLGIPGKTFELIDAELKDQYKTFPDWVFKRETKKEMLKNCNDFLESVNIIHV